MANMTKKRLADLVRTMLENIFAPSSEEATSCRRQYQIHDYGPLIGHPIEGQMTNEVLPDSSARSPSIFILINAGCDAFDDYMKEAAKDEIIASKISRTALRDALDELLRSLRREDDITEGKLNDAIRQWLKSTRTLVKTWQAFVPIDNLILSGIDELRVGKVIFRPYSDVESVIRSRFDVGVDGALDSDDVKELLKQQWPDVWLPLYRSAATCAEVTIDAEERRLPELVDSEVDASLNLLRCYTNLLFPRDNRAFIGLRGVVAEAARPTIGFATENGGFVSTVRQVGTQFRYAIDSSRLEHMKSRCAFDVLSGVLNKPAELRTQLEEVVVTAIRWLGRGVVATEMPEQVVNICISLERLLTTKDEEHTDITDRLARRLAFLLAEDAESREKIFDRMKELYGMRGEVVHAGRTDIHEVDLIEIENLAVRALIRMAARLGDWTTHADLAKWAKKQSFGSAASTE